MERGEGLKAAPRSPCFAYTPQPLRAGWQKERLNLRLALRKAGRAVAVVEAQMCDGQHEAVRSAAPSLAGGRIKLYISLEVLKFFFGDCKDRKI